MLSDLDIGMNDWWYQSRNGTTTTCPTADEFCTTRPERNRGVLSLQHEDHEFISRARFPAPTPKALLRARFGHDKFGRYTETLTVYQEVVDRLKTEARRRRATRARAGRRQAPRRHRRIITIGSCDLAVREAIDELAEQGLVADFMRVRGFPFVADVRQFVEEHERCFVVEQNRDAQLRSLISSNGAEIEKMRSSWRTVGTP